MSTDKVTELRPGSQRYEFSHLGQDTVLMFDDRYLIKEWKNGITKGKNTFLLHRLSPNIVEETIINSESLKLVRLSWVLLIAATVVFFSTYNSNIPLLAPALAGIGVVLLVANIRKTWPRDWSLVYDEYNYKQVAIPIIDDDEETSKDTERHKFIRSLSDAIEVAKKKELYDV